MFPGTAMYYGLLLPIALVLAANAVIFVIVIYKINCRRTSGTPTPAGTPKDSSAQKREDVVRRVQNVIAVTTLLGLTWIFGFMSTANDKLFHILFSVFNSLQGLFIFLLFCLRQPDVQERLKHLRAHVMKRGRAASSADGQRKTGHSHNSTSNVTQSADFALTSLQGSEEKTNLSSTSPPEYQHTYSDITSDQVYENACFELQPTQKANTSYDPFSDPPDKQGTCAALAVKEIHQNEYYALGAPTHSPIATASLKMTFSKSAFTSSETSDDEDDYEAIMTIDGPSK